jgi:outer membrane putative beta-barrel porin/alpha-amylase
MQKATTIGCAVALGIGAVSFSYAADGDLSVGAGVNYSTGKYGTSQETRIISVPFSARYETDKWLLKATVPWLSVTSPANVIPGVGSFDQSGRRRRRSFGGTTTESGLGDTVLSATYTAYYNEDAERGIDLTGRVKLPTADADKGLGTGSTDESVQVDLYQTFDRVMLFGDVGYTFFGDSDFVQLQNTVNYGVGVSNKFSSTDSIGVSYDARQRASVGGFPQRDLTGFWNHRTSRDTRLQAYVSKGLARGSPDFGFGVSALFGF